MAEAMQWPVAGLERALESWAYLIVAWVNANGGEARYEPEYVDHNGPQTPDRIALRRADGWTYVSPGQWVVMGEHGFEVVVDSADGTKYLCRDFYPSDFPPAAASCGSPDTLEATDLAAKRRERKSRDDGTCPTCGRHRVLCSPMGRECVYAEKKAPAVRGEFR